MQNPKYCNAIKRLLTSLSYDSRLNTDSNGNDALLFCATFDTPVQIVPYGCEHCSKEQTIYNQWFLQIWTESGSILIEQYKSKGYLTEVDNCGNWTYNKMAISGI